MVYKVGVKARFLDFLNGKISCELINYRADHLDMSKLFGSYIV